jgi:acyl-CoA thioesterase
LTPFSQLLASMTLDGTVLTARVTDDWRQGRTLYGGLSTALCVAAALRVFPALPPLRSAQFVFVGPASGTVHATPMLLRRGKSTVFVSIDLTGDDGLATRALLCFGAARASALAHGGLSMVVVPPPEDCAAFFVAGGAPNFAQHFDSRLALGARPVSAAADPDMALWLRHRDAVAGHGTVALVALADAAPPAAMAMFTAPAPISTMTWMVDILADAPADDDGWRLMRSTAETVADGYSSQAMTIWTRAGLALLAARQCVAIFA